MPPGPSPPASPTARAGCTGGTGDSPPAACSATAAASMPGSLGGSTARTRRTRGPRPSQPGVPSSTAARGLPRAPSRSSVRRAPGTPCSSWRRGGWLGFRTGRQYGRRGWSERGRWPGATSTAPRRGRGSRPMDPGRGVGGQGGRGGRPREWAGGRSGLRPGKLPSRFRTGFRNARGPRQRVGPRFPGGTTTTTRASLESSGRESQTRHGYAEDLRQIPLLTPASLPLPARPPRFLSRQVSLAPKTMMPPSFVSTSSRAQGPPGPARSSTPIPGLGWSWSSSPFCLAGRDTLRRAVATAPTRRTRRERVPATRSSSASSEANGCAGSTRAREAWMELQREMGSLKAENQLGRSGAWSRGTGGGRVSRCGRKPGVGAEASLASDPSESWIRCAPGGGGDAPAEDAPSRHDARATARSASSRAPSQHGAHFPPIPLCSSQSTRSQENF